MATDDTFGLPPLPPGFEPIDPGMPAIGQVPMPEFSAPAPVASPSGFVMPDAYVEAIKGFEGFAPQSKWDYKQNSVGYGTRGAPGETITPEIADARLREELAKAAALVDKHAPDAPQGVKAALTSLTFNAGDRWATSGLGDAIRKGDYERAKQQFSRYTKAGGTELPGLVARRQQELAWFDETPDSGGSVQLTADTGTVDLPPLPSGFTPIDAPASAPASGGLPPLPKGFTDVNEKPAGKPAATFSQSVGRGVDQMQGMLYGGIEAMGEATGNKWLTDTGKEGRTRNDAEAKAYGDPSEFLKIRSAGDFGQWAKETIGSQIPIMGPMLGGAIAGTIVGGPIGGVIGAFVPGFVMSTGETQGNIKEKDPNAVAPGSAFIGGAAIAALDSVLPGKVGSALVRKFGVEAAEEIAKRTLSKPVTQSMLKTNAKGVVEGMATEGVTEALQEAIGDVAASYGTGKPLDPNLGSKMLEAGAAGALLGGIMGPMGGPVQVSPGDEEKNTIPPSAAQPPTQPSPASSGPVPSPPPQATPDEAGILAQMGYGQDDIAGMTRDEVQAELASAASQGITAGQGAAPVQAPAPTADAPSAEPIADLTAQIADLASGSRQGVYLSPENIANVSANETFSSSVQTAIGSVKGAEIVENVDGKGGVLAVKDKATADAVRFALENGADVQKVIGKLTGAGTGKVPGADTVVQQRTPEGAVTRETLVPAAKAPAAAEELAAPGRTVETLPAEAAIARREEGIAAEQAAPAPIGDGSRKAPVKVEIPEDVTAAAKAAAADYTPAQGEANNRKLGHAKWNGLDISIETEAGGVRKGVDKKTGQEWSTTMGAAYGYIKGGATSADGMALDVYMGTDPASDRVWVIDEVDRDDPSSFRQHKAMIAFPDQESAVAAYTGTSSKSAETIGAVTEMPIEQFRAWARDGKKTKPIGTIGGQKAGQESAQPSNPSKKKPAKSPATALAVIRNLGGIQPNADLRQIADRVRIPGLFNKNGLTPDDMLRALEERNFIQDKSGPNRPIDTSLQDLYDLVEKIIAGERVGEFGVEVEKPRSNKAMDAEYRDTVDRDLASIFEELGLRNDLTDAETDRLLDLVAYEKMDVVDALERIAIESIENEAAANDGAGSVEEGEGTGGTVEEPSPQDVAGEPSEVAGRPSEPEATPSQEPVAEVDQAPETGPFESGPVPSFADVKALVKDQPKPMTALSDYLERKGFPGWTKMTDAQRRETFADIKKLYGGESTVEPAPAQADTPKPGKLGTTLADLTKRDQGNKAAVDRVSGETKAETADAGKGPKDRGPDRLKDYTGITIDGYEGQSVGAEERDGSLKRGFLSDARDYLNKVAKDLAARGFEPHPDTKGKKPKPGRAVSVNPTGPAVSGDVSMSVVDKDGNGVYVNIGTTLAGPNGGISLMARKATSTDRYGTKGQNQWLPVDLPVKELADRLERIARPAAKAPAPEVATEAAAPVEAKKPDVKPGDPEWDFIPNANWRDHQVKARVYAAALRIPFTGLDTEAIVAAIDKKMAEHVGAPEGVSLMLSDTTLDGEDARIKGGQYKAVAQRKSPWSSVDGYGSNPLEAAKDAVRRIKPAQTSLVPEATTKEKIEAEAKAKADKGKGSTSDAGELFNPDAGKQTDLVDMAKKPVETEKPADTYNGPRNEWSETRDRLGMIKHDANGDVAGSIMFDAIRQKRDPSQSWVALDADGNVLGYAKTAGAAKDIVEGKAAEKPADAAPAPKAETQPETEKPATAKAEAEETASPQSRLVDRLLDSENPLKDIRDTRKFAREIGLVPEDATSKQIEEAVEAGIVAAARVIVAERSKSGPEWVYKGLVSLYGRQPNLAARTGTSVANQAYSTPVPLAYLAGRLADVRNADEVYEPSAGNGALLIDVISPSKVYANEIDPDRAAALKAQGFNVTSKDGAEVPTLTDIDSVIMNPPFGAVKDGGKSKVFELGDLTTTKIDHAISLNALEAMAEDGKAVLIIGGTKAEDATERAKSYRGLNMKDAKTGKGKDNFYRVLYDRYNVTDHFTVSGDLYTKQGASWPVDVIVIEGRGKSQRPLPGTPKGVPVLLKSWDEIAEKIPNDTANGGKSDRPARAPVEPVEKPAPVDEVRSDATVGTGPDTGKPEAGTKPTRVRKDTAGGQPEGGRSDAVGDGDVPAGGRGDRGRIDRDRAPRRERVVVAEGATQAKYEPVSGSQSVDTLVPASMADSSRNAMERVEQKHGNVDDFVQDALGYEADADGMFFIRTDPETGEKKKERPFSAEQIDAIAMAIDNVEKGAAIVVGDATGIGKGRIGAGMLRYAIKQGLVPVLMTEKMDLYGDMYRDMRDIGMFEMLGREPRILTTDVGKSIPLDEEAVSWKADAELAEEAGEPLPPRRGKFLSGGSAPAKDKAYDRLLAGDKDVADVVFTTYSQMQTLGEGKAIPRRRSVLGAIAPRAMMVLDETHNAGGQGVVDDNRAAKAAEGGRAEFVRELASKAKGLLFMSATYAKRPNVMDLYARTDMGKAVEDIKDLPKLIQRGGVPMQQIVASMLAESGQYLRRERSFDGIEYAVEEAKVDEDAYDKFVGSVQSIFRFDLQVEPARAEIIEEILAELGAGTGGRDGGVGEASARSTSFASIMHNIVTQMLLAIKANAAADRAIEALKAGEKPVITLANTNESFISDFAEMDGTTIGGTLDIDFGAMLKRYLQRTLRVTYKEAGEKKPKHYQIPLERMPASVQKAYRDIEALIDAGNYDGMPVSPIDWIRNRITKAGYTVREVTGRKTMLDYSRSAPKLVMRPKGEAGSAGKRVTLAKFNAGTLDAVILNQSGSTGVSIHANRTFKDQRKRRMILAQAEANIDTHMQMLGRVNRTGQVVLPAYSQLAAGIPAEVRPTAVLMKKMASLNANTTGARGSTFTAEAADFMNEVGDKVMAEYLWENPEINNALGEPYDGVEIKDVVQHATGKLVLLTVAQQREMLDTVQKNYAREIEQLDALGENPLEAKMLDLQAETLETVELKARTGDSPFTDAVRIEKVSVKSQGRAMPVSEVAGKVADALKVAKPEGSDQVALEQLERKGRDWLTTESRRIQDLARRQLADELAETKPDSREGVRSKALATLSRWQQTMNIAYPGARVSLGMPSGDLDGIVMSVERSGKAKSITALSAWTVKIAVPDSARQFEFPMSKLFPPGIAKSEDEKGATVTSARTFLPMLISAFEDARKEGRETRFIVTGNILGGYDQTGGKGRIVNFTTKDGQVRPGVLMERGFAVDKFMKSRSIRFQTGTQIASFIDKVSDVEVSGRDGDLVLGKGRYGYYIQMARARGKAGKYYTDKAVRATIAPKEFATRGNRMMAEDLGREQFVRAVDEMKKVGAVFETDTAQDEAQAIIAESQPVSAALTPSIAKNAIGKLLDEGKPYLVPARRVETQIEAVRSLAHMLPEDTYAGALERIEPETDSSFDPMNWTMTGHFRLTDGTTLKLKGLTRQTLTGTRAFVLPPALARRLTGGRPAILLTNLGGSRDLGRTVRGETWHELLHVLWGQGHLDVATQFALFRHARSLRILDMPRQDFYAKIGDPNADQFAGGTLRDVYTKYYATRENRADLISQEAVAHMLELYAHGGLTAEQMAPVQGIIDDMGAGRLPRKMAAAQDSEELVAALDVSTGQSLFSAVPPKSTGAALSIDDKIANIDAIVDHIKSMGETRRPLNPRLDVVMEPDRNGRATYYVLGKGKNVWNRDGSASSSIVGRFDVKPSQRLDSTGVEVTNALVTEGQQRQGIGTAVYDLVAADFAAFGGVSPSPDEQLSPLAQAFWKKRLTPRAAAAQRNIEAAVNDAVAIVNRMTGLGAVDVSFRDSIPIVGISAEALQSARDMGIEPIAQGVYHHRTLDAKALIELSTGVPNADLRTTAGHEAYHHVETVLATPQELKLLRSSSEMARARNHAAVEIGRSIEDVAKLPDYEIRAIAFQRYRRLREEGAPMSPLHIGVRRVWDRLIRVFQNVRNALRGQGFDSMESIFELARTGEMVYRQAAAKIDARPPFHAIPILLPKQVRTTNYISREPFDLNNVREVARYTGDVPLDAIYTVQKGVSPSGAKAKLRNFASDGPVSVFKWGNAYYVNDGNHRIEAARAQGRASIIAEVIELGPKSPNDGSRSLASRGSADVPTKPVGAPKTDRLAGIRAVARRAANDDAAAASGQDVKAFADQWLTASDGASTTATALYEGYVEWAEESGAEVLPLPSFNQAMADAGYMRQRIAGRDRYVGVAVKAEGSRPAARITTSEIADVNAAEVAAEVGKGVSIFEALRRVYARLVQTLGLAPDQATKTEARLAHIERMQMAIANDNSATAAIHGNVVSLPSQMASFFPTATSSGTFLGRKVAATMRRMTPSQATTDALRVRIQDKFLPMRRQQEAIERQTGADLPLPLDVYVAEALYHGRTGEQAADLQEKHVEPLVEHLRKNEITGDELGDYLYARHAQERNAYIRTIDPANDAGSGMTDADAQAALARIQASPKAQAYADAAAMVDAINKQTRATLLSAGLISRETYDAWESDYQHYVPLRGFEIVEDEPVFPRVGKGFNVRGPEAYQALGRRSKSDNPVAYVLLQAQQAIVRAEKNRVNKTLMRLVQAHPDPNVWQVYKGEYKRTLKTDPATGQEYVDTVFVPPQFSAHDPSIVGVKIGGKQHYIQLHNPNLARALKGVGSSEFDHAIVRNMMALTRFYAQLLTSWNPEFVVGNFFRDVSTALLNSKDVADLPAGARKKMLAEALSLKSIRGIYNALRGDGSTEHAQYFEEFRQAGGKISFMEYNDVERIKQRINGLLTQGNTMRAIRRVAKYVEDVNTSVENGVRLSTFIAMRKAGIPAARAAYVARELTVNFNRKGEWGPIINSAYMFFNASVQGSTRMLQAIAKSKAVRRAVYAIAFGGMAMELLNYMIAGDDDDKENAYEKIKPWIKERNMIFMLPGRKDYIMIPMPYGYNVPFIAGQKIGEMIRTGMGHGKLTPAKAASGIMTSLLESFNPLGTSPALLSEGKGSFLQMVSPTILDPIVQVAENRTWYGGPIFPTKFDKNKPDSESYFASVHPAFIGAAKFLNATTGGNAAKSGIIDVSPEVLEHYAQFLGGGVSKFLLNATGTGQRALSGDEFIPEKTPILRRLYGKQTTASRRSDFYEAWTKVDGARYEVIQLNKAGDTEGSRAAREANKAEIEAYGAMKATQVALSKYSKQRTQIQLNRSLSDTEKKTKLDEIKERENQMILRALEVYQRAQKKKGD